MTFCTINGFTRRGSGRDQNEDACGIGDILLFGKDTNSGQKSVELSQLPFLVTLADGLGGHSSGDIASRTAIERLNDIFKSSRGSLRSMTQLPMSIMIFGSWKKVVEVPTPWEPQLSGPL